MCQATRQDTWTEQRRGRRRSGQPGHMGSQPLEACGTAVEREGGGGGAGSHVNVSGNKAEHVTIKPREALGTVVGRGGGGERGTGRHIDELGKKAEEGAALCQCVGQKRKTVGSIGVGSVEHRRGQGRGVGGGECMSMCRATRDDTWSR